MQVYSCIMICMSMYVNICICMDIICMKFYEYACAHILRVSFSVSLGCFQTDARTEPGSWLVMGMFPVSD